MNTINESPTFSNDQLNKMSKEQLITLLRFQIDQLGEKEKQITNLTEQINLLLQKRFGRSSEKNCEGQLSIFNEAEVTATAGSSDDSAEEPTEETTEDSAEESVEETQVVTYTRKKGKMRKQIDISQFPVVRIEHKLTEEESNCERCGKGMKVVSTETVKRLRYVPAHIEVEEHITYIYACVDSACDFMKRASKDKPLLKGSLATGSIVAAIMNGKYTMGLPLYRIEDEFKRNGLELDRKRMSHWVIRCAEEYLSLIYNALKGRFLACRYKQADETTVQVLHELERKATTNSYMWVYLTGELCDTPPIILYKYEKTRAGHHPKEFLGTNSCYLTTDGYQAYHSLPSEIQVTGCWAHARRKFFDILKTLPAKNRKGSIADEAVQRIAKLYEIEREIRELSPEKRYSARQERSKPLVEAFFAWLEPMPALMDSQSALCKAVQYALNQQQYLLEFLNDGNIPIDNNASERAVKPFVMGRKAWLFCNTPNGAEASAIIYSIVETAKANGCHVYSYLRYLLETIPNHMDDTNLDFIEHLLPWASDLPSSCKINHISDSKS